MRPTESRAQPIVRWRQALHASARRTAEREKRKRSEGATGPWYNERMPSFRVQTPQRAYEAIVERGSVARIAEFVPARAGKIFVITSEDVWSFHADRVERALEGRAYQVLFFPGGEPRKRMAEVEALAEQMVEGGGDRSSVVVAF